MDAAFQAGDELGVAQGKAIAFAEMSLNLFTSFVESLSVGLDGQGIAYVAESSTGSMLACTDPAAVFDANGDRLFAFNSTDAGVASTFARVAGATASGSLTLDSEVSDWRMSAYRYVDQELDWVIVVAVPSPSIFTDMTSSIVKSAMICLGVVLAAIAVSALVAFEMHRSALHLAGLVTGKGEPSKALGVFSDNDPVEYEILNGGRPPAKE